MQLNDYEIRHNTFLRENGAECTVLLKKDGHFPLAKACELALYGNGARRTIKGGTGSGEVNSRFFVTVEDGLKNAGFTITSSSWLDRYDKICAAAEKKFIRQIKAEAKEHHIPPYLYGMGRIMPEPEYELPTDAAGTTAVYVLARISGEGNDRMPVKGDILLTDAEKRDILACNEKYENFILVINAGGVVDLSDVKDVKNILVLSQLGVETGDILADIILGKSNPSGKLATTWSAWGDYSQIGDFGDVNETRYKEGVYVGYRYFDSVGKKAMYPFGFGLSYSSFSYEFAEASIQKDVVTVCAKVKNTGAYPGMEVLQLYVSVPEGKLDQPYQMLAGFQKTKCLASGEEEEIKVTFSMREIASYDTERAVWLLEPGNYILRLGNSSVDTKVCATVSLAREIITEKVKNVLGTPDFTDFCVKKDAPSETELAGVKPLVLEPEAIATVTPKYDPVYEIEPVVKELTEEQLIKMNIGAFDPAGGIAGMIGNSGITVAGAAGQTYLGALERGIGTMIMADGPAGVRISRQYAVDKDGGVHTIGSSLPESLLRLMPGVIKMFLKFKGYRVKKTDVIKEQYATAIPIGTAIAQSFRTEFARKCGEIVGFEMEKFGVHLWLAPALNIHRSIQCGRNFEYYSEDPLVSGEMTAAITQGVQSHKGCGVTIKHYAANNQEINRTQNNSQVSERAMREIYLRGFGIAVRKGQPKAVMTSYNLLNGVHTGAHRGLIEDILRAEFGHRGIVMTDWNVGNFMAAQGYVHPMANAPESVCAGNDLYMPGGRGDYSEVEKALSEGRVSKEQLQINASRVVRMAKELVKSSK